MKATTPVFALLLCFIFFCNASAQQAGDPVILTSSNISGVPVHPSDGNNSYVRWPNGTAAVVTAVSTQTSWRQVESNGMTGWVTVNYLQLAGEPDEEPTNEELSYAVGAWNLEWLKDGKTRGFPENTYTPRGPTYQSRTDADYQTIAETIRDRIDAKILVLSEINGASAAHSVELNRLRGKLGGRWGYFLSPSAGEQRLAIVYDSSFARCNKCVEIQVPEKKIQNKDIFDRDPLVCSFTFLENGVAKNDLLVVAVHLASGQQLYKNHDTAMTLLAAKLAVLTSNNTFSSNEKDILIAGDFNASRYDTYRESLWTNTSPALFRFKTLSPEDGEEYPGTRLKGVPLTPASKIDYIMISSCTGGLVDEVVEPIARVHHELLPENFNLFREHQSDHIPVTVHVRLTADND